MHLYKERDLCPIISSFKGNFNYAAYQSIIPAYQSKKVKYQNHVNLALKFRQIGNET
jgi:hypothetical protein